MYNTIAQIKKNLVTKISKNIQLLKSNTIHLKKSSIIQLKNSPSYKEQRGRSPFSTLHSKYQRKAELAFIWTTAEVISELFSSFSNGRIAFPNLQTYVAVITSCKNILQPLQPSDTIGSYFTRNAAINRGTLLPISQTIVFTLALRYYAIYVCGILQKLLIYEIWTCSYPEKTSVIYPIVYSVGFYGDWISNYYYLVDVINEWFMLFLQKNLRLEQNLREIQFWHLSVTQFDVYYRKPLAHCTSFSALLHSIEMLGNGFWKVCVSVGAPILLFLKSQSLDLRAHLRVPTCGWLNLTECEVSLMRRATCALLSR